MSDEKEEAAEKEEEDKENSGVFCNDKVATVTARSGNEPEGVRAQCH